MENLVIFFLTVLCFFYQTNNCKDLTCSRPTPPDNAYIYTGKRKLKEKYGLNEVVMFRCKIGNGASFMKCITSGWSQITNLQCLPIECRDPGRPVNGARYPDRNKYVFKDRIRFQCKTNYTLSGFPYITCQQDKRWSGNVPRCLEACLRPNKYPVNGGIRGSYISYRHKYSIRYYCNRGYNLVGREYVRCLNGTWENKQPTCRPVECRDSGRPVNGGRYPDRNKYVFKDKIDFQCNTNYTLRGDSSITCQQDKRWSGNVPKCLAPCKDPGIPNNGQRHDHSFLHNASVRFSCRRGWNIQGSQTITCNDGNWDRTTPVCMECASALGMEDGKIPDSNIRASSTRWIYHAKYGRLNGRYAWCSGVGRDPYLQIDFGKPYRITGLATQGSAYNNRWVENYTVTSNLAGSSFNIYREDNRDKIFIGNRDKGSVVKNKLSNPVIARRLRIYPKKQGGFSYFNPACVRVEIYGCDLPSGKCIVIIRI
ncbi:CUB and sushi domain-containing protein 1-like, partial [Actinia tenebrosa]|uniref:CUB and sushi domain-containing protein 1-like n=1 Tax=Actinia tenebrosa TaxID=6105 RepID=A0A6P8HV46_ACTTE